MNIQNRFLLPVVGTLLLATLCGTGALIYSLSSFAAKQEASAAKLANQLFQQQAAAKIGEIDKEIARTCEDALKQAVIFSQVDVVKQAYKMALNGNIDDAGDAKVQEARVFLRQRLKPVISEYRKLLKVDELRLHFHLPNSRSFVRTWRDGWQIKKDGKKIDISDDLSGFRQTLVSLNRSHLPTVTGIEIGRGGFVLRGICAVNDDQGRHLGSCEAYYSFAQLFSSDEAQSSCQMAAFMDAEQLKVATTMQDPAKFPLLGERYVLSSASNPQQFLACMTPELLDQGRVRPFFKFTQQYFVAVFPIHDFSGATVGVFALNYELDHLQQVKEEMQASSHAALGAIRNSIIIGMGLTLGLISLIIFTIARAISRPLRESVTLLEAISLGDLTQTVSPSLNQRRDEIGAMAQALEKMLAGLKQIFTDLGQGVTTLVNASGRLAGVSEETAGGVRQMAERSQSVAAAAEEASSNTSSMAAGMEEVAGNLTSVAGATEEMNATVREIAESSEKARGISEAAIGQTEIVGSTMHQLEEAAREITKVTETINHISSQTNLLALNATIEAARAGDAGKGFAVVAGEIKELAMQTAEATNNIKNMISGIQTSTESAVSNIEGISKVIQDVGGLINDIAAAIEEQATVTAEVAENVAKSSIEVNDNNQRLAQTAKVSQEIAADVEKVNLTVGDIREGNELVNQQARELSELAGNLETIVKKFRI
ncbi:MAG: HAMP domain-containing protein [Desulfuromonadales bacterium]|nr:HAMP domain-containing protein [Desulfuromonadales bacterium]